MQTLRKFVTIGCPQLSFFANQKYLVIHDLHFATEKPLQLRCLLGDIELLFLSLHHLFADSPFWVDKFVDALMKRIKHPISSGAICLFLAEKLHNYKGLGAEKFFGARLQVIHNKLFF